MQSEDCDLMVGPEVAKKLVMAGLRDLEGQMQEQHPLLSCSLSSLIGRPHTVSWPYVGSSPSPKGAGPESAAGQVGRDATAGDVWR